MLAFTRGLGGTKPLFPTPKRKEACPLWTLSGAYNLLPHPSPVPDHQHTWSVSYYGYDYLLHGRLKLYLAWKLSGTQISCHNQCDSKYLFRWIFKKFFQLDHSSGGFLKSEIHIIGQALSKNKLLVSQPCVDPPS